MPTGAAAGAGGDPSAEPLRGPAQWLLLSEAVVEGSRPTTVDRVVQILP